LTRFALERRERFLTLLETGRNVEEACAAVGVGRATVTRWAATGRADPGRAEHAAFADRYDAIREGRGDAGLAVVDVVRLLERAARAGSVQAMKLLLDRLDRTDSQETTADSERDPFTALEGDELGRRRRERGQ
jgi:hypothetical protein